MIRMPLKLKLGRCSGRYELSEDIYILTVLVGDMNIAQCTLTSLSTSEDVFRYLAEKLSLKQTELFGLQYQMKATDTEKRMQRWIEPDKPIRRQLERWACRREKKWAVNLGILHACANVFTLHDTVSRSLYYLVLRTELLQGTKYKCELDRYINLAAYQLQIEYGDLGIRLEHPECVNMLPQNIRNPSEELYTRIIGQYEKLQTMQPAYAALLYIVEVQQCEGYAEEAFPCKDGSSLEEVSLGYSLDWIFVRRPNGTTDKYRWEEVREITANKRKVSVKCGETGTSAVFCFEDNEMARYVSTVLGWKWRHARTDAQQQKGARLSVHNLQGGVPSLFGAPGTSVLRRSNGNVNAVRPSESSSTSYMSSCAFLPSTPQMSSARDSQSTVHSVKSFVRPQYTPPMNTSLAVCCRSVSVGQMAPSALGSQTPFLRPAAERVSPPSSAAFYPPNAIGAPQAQSNSSQDSTDWLRNEQREVLKKMLCEKRRLNKIGSSPEINTVGLSKGSAVAMAKCSRRQLAHQQATQGSGFALARKTFTSTPNLNNNASAAKQAAAAALQQNNLSSGTATPMVLMPSPQMAPAHRVTSLGVHTHFLSNYGAPPSPHLMNGAAPTMAQHQQFVGATMNGQNGMLTPKMAAQPLGPSVPLFSQGQMIDENGQQRPIVYPIPPEALPQPQSTAASALFYLPAASSSPPAVYNTSNGPTAAVLEQQLDHNSRSSPKSNATTASYSESMLGANQTCAAGTAGGAAAALPEFSELEFSGIPAKSLSADFSVAVRAHNLHRNRGSKIYPYNENRVRLTPTKANPDGYINASSVSVPVGRQCLLRYVVSQAPIAKTIEDFWQLVWESGARLIVMLVNPHQINKDDTIPSYIPNQAKEKLSVGAYFLRLKSVSPPMQMLQFQSTTTFVLSHRGQRRTIFHLYCADFSEQGVPSSMDTFIGLLDAVASVKRHIENEAKRTGGQQEQQHPLAKCGSSASKDSKSSGDGTKEQQRTRAVSELPNGNGGGGGGWAKRLRFESNGSAHKAALKRNNSAAEKKLLSSTAPLREEPLAIVQCTDGASESGLYLLAEVVIRCIENNAAIDIAQLLRELRYQRMGLVKNASQYKFICDLVAHYERRSRLV